MNIIEGRIMEANLYLCCYDIQDDNIRHRVYKTLQQYQSGGQYSAYECYLNSAQKTQLESELNKLIETCDSVKFQILHNIQNIICLGKATRPLNEHFLYIG
jgi:CRISPR-associated endonuclease Cas2